MTTHTGEKLGPYRSNTEARMHLQQAGGGTITAIYNAWDK